MAINEKSTERYQREVSHLTNKYSHAKMNDQPVTMRYPVRFALDTTGGHHNESNVVAIQGLEENEDGTSASTHFCLLMNPPPNAHQKAEEIDVNQCALLELLFTTTIDSPESKKRVMPAYGIPPSGLDGFVFMVNLNTRQTPKHQASIKASTSEKQPNTNRNSECVSFLDQNGYGLNITADGDPCIIGKNGSLVVSSKVAIDAPISSNELTGNFLTTENFFSKYCLIPENCLPTWIVSQDPTINVIEILDAYNEINMWVQLTEGLMDIYDAFKA